MTDYISHRVRTNRVRTLIPHLNYKTLKQDKVLPDVSPMFTAKTVPTIGGKFPKLVKNMGYSSFGLFCDYFIRKILSLQHNIESKVKDISPYNLYLMFDNEKKQVSKEEFTKDKDYYQEISDFICENFYKAEDIQFEPELSYSSGSVHISGHPDVIIDNCIYDIKTTGRFSKMRILTIFQLLSYYALYNEKNPNIITHVGLILPAQKKVVKVKISGWDWKPFLNQLCDCVKIVERLSPSPIDIIMFQLTVYPYVGATISKDKTLYNTIKNHDPMIPCQIFFAGRTKADFKITDSELQKLSDLVINSKYRVYVHSPYTLNLSKKYDDNWVVNSLKKNLNTASIIGCKGVVVHCGIKTKDVEYATAYDNMTYSVVESVCDATEECPLLIETSAGETGELLSHPEEMVVFYNNLPDEVRRKVKICVDTCHVFSAGYIPMDYIRMLEENKVPIGLVHYNDSEGDKGCCKDSHARIGTGYIGLSEMINVGNYCIQNNISMVVE